MLSDRLNSAVDLLVCGTVRIRLRVCVVHAEMIVDREGGLRAKLRVEAMIYCEVLAFPKGRWGDCGYYEKSRDC